MRAVVRVFWGNPTTTPPPEIETLPDGRTLWCCTVLASLSSRTDMTDALDAPRVIPGSGWCHGWSPITDPPKRWSGDRKAATRRRNLRRRIEKKVPLFADLYEAEELARRPDYFDATSIEAADRRSEES